MKLLYWLILITLLIQNNGCSYLHEWSVAREKEIFHNYRNQALVKWYQNQFLPKIQVLEKKSPDEMYVIEKIEPTFLGVKINYTQEMNHDDHSNYAFVHENTLN